MKEIYYTYNNEAIASCVFVAVLRKIGTVDMARACLILPFLLDDKTVSYLKNNVFTEQNLQEFTTEHRRLFTSFNKRYLALLPIAINALLMLHKGGQILITREITDQSTIDFDSADFGERFYSIRYAIPNFLALTADLSTVQLYKILKIQL